MHYILFEHLSLSLSLSWTFPVQCETVQPGSRAAGEVREMTTWVTWVSLMVTIPDTDLGEMIQMILPQCLQLVHTHSLHQWWTQENQLWKYRNDLYWEFERICLNLCREVYIAFKVEVERLTHLEPYLPWTMMIFAVGFNSNMWTSPPPPPWFSPQLSPYFTLIESTSLPVLKYTFLTKWNCKNIIKYFLPQFNGCDHSIQVNFSSISPLTSSIACKVRF